MARGRKFRHTLAIDWDGTLVPSKWPEQPREWMPGAVEALEEFSSYANPMIWTARINPWDPQKWVKQDPEVVEWEVNYIREMLLDAGLDIPIWTHEGKPTASVYIDDKAERYHGRPGSWKAMRLKVAARFGEADAQFPPAALERMEEEA